MRDAGAMMARVCNAGFGCEFLAGVERLGFNDARSLLSHVS